MNSKVAKILIEYFKKGQKDKIKDAAKLLGYKSPSNMLAAAHGRASKASAAKKAFQERRPGVGDLKREGMGRMTGGPNPQSGEWMNPYISVYKPVSGYKAILRDKTGEPIQTGLSAYRTREEAIQEAKGWAEAEGLEFFADIGF